MIKETPKQCLDDYLKVHYREKTPLRPIVFIGKFAHEQSEMLYDYAHEHHPHLKIYFNRNDITAENAFKESFGSDYIIDTNKYRLKNDK